MLTWDSSAKQCLNWAVNFCSKTNWNEDMTTKQLRKKLQKFWRLPTSRKHSCVAPVSPTLHLVVVLKEHTNPDDIFFFCCCFFWLIVSGHGLGAPVRFRYFIFSFFVCVSLRFSGGRDTVKKAVLASQELCSLHRTSVVARIYNCVNKIRGGLTQRQIKEGLRDKR